MKPRVKSWLLTAVIISVDRCTGFSIFRPSQRLQVRLRSASELEVDELLDSNPVFAGSKMIDLSIFPHRPLGCTIEESLAGEGYVFVAKVVSGGCAERAGLREGDVIVGLSNVFGEVTDALSEGVEKVKGLVASRPDDEHLEIRVARGSRVQEEHEEALVELCSNPGAMDEDVEQCVSDFLIGTYMDDSVSEIDIECADKSDDECLVDNLYSMWAEDLPPRPVAPKIPETKKDERTKPKPWSSRSSPSGTFVRDPKTGKMKNIDG